MWLAWVGAIALLLRGRVHLLNLPPKKQSAIGFLGYSEKAIFALFWVRVQRLDTYPEKTVFYE